MWIKIIAGIVLLTLGMLAFLYAIDSRNREAPEAQEFSLDRPESYVPEAPSDNTRQRPASLRAIEWQRDAAEMDVQNDDEDQLDSEKPRAGGESSAPVASIESITRAEREALDAIIGEARIATVPGGDRNSAPEGPGDISALGPATEAKREPSSDLPLQDTDPGFDGLAPEAGDTGELGLAPEAGQPLSIGPAPEASDPGTMAPGPEDSVPTG